MADDTMAFRIPLRATSDANLQHEMIAFAAESSMVPEMQALTGFGQEEPTPDRLRYRNGYADALELPGPCRSARTGAPASGSAQGIRNGT